MAETHGSVSSRSEELDSYRQLNASPLPFLVQGHESGPHFTDYSANNQSSLPIDIHAGTNGQASFTPNGGISPQLFWLPANPETQQYVPAYTQPMQPPTAYIHHSPDGNAVWSYSMPNDVYSPHNNNGHVSKESGHPVSMSGAVWPLHAVSPATSCPTHGTTSHNHVHGGMMHDHKSDTPNHMQPWFSQGLVQPLGVSPNDSNSLVSGPLTFLPVTTGPFSPVLQSGSATGQSPPTSNYDFDSQPDFDDEPLTANTSPGSVFSGLYPTQLLNGPPTNGDNDYKDDTYVDPKYFNSRDHPLFSEVKADPSDGKFHCPFERQGCGHEPALRPCNVHKNIDSHLRQYRCKDPGCADLKMSSQACKLRHEREEHGKHGHGRRPFPCPWPDCDRHKNGFKRDFNRGDHLQRIHNGEEPKPGTTHGLQFPSRPIAKCRRARTIPTKRKSTRVRSPSSPHPQAQEAGLGEVDIGGSALLTPSANELSDVEKKEMLDRWVSQYKTIHDLIHTVNNPSNTPILDKLEHEMNAWLTLAKELRPHIPVEDSGQIFR